MCNCADLWVMHTLCYQHYWVSYSCLFSNKAVADGAIMSYVDLLISSWALRFTYGIECTRDYVLYLPDHQRRQDAQFILPSETMVLPDAFKSILLKVWVNCLFMATVDWTNHRELKFPNNKNSDILFPESRSCDPNWLYSHQLSHIEGIFLTLIRWTRNLVKPADNVLNMYGWQKLDARTVHGHVQSDYWCIWARLVIETSKGSWWE